MGGVEHPARTCQDNVNFEILSNQLMYKGKILDVEQVEARLPNGQVGRFDLVKHNDSVSILPLDNDGNIWFISQYRFGAGKELLELPAGVIESNEDALDCAHREIREEIGMDAGSVILLGKAYLAPGYCTEAMYFFLARDLYRAPLNQDEDEFIEVKKFPIASLAEMIGEGLIQDSKSLAALTLASRYL